MHYSNLFNKVYYDNQQVFNKKLNWYFDIKNILYRNDSNRIITKNTNQIVKEYSSLKDLKFKKEKKSFSHVSYTHITLQTTLSECISRWSPDH